MDGRMAGRMVVWPDGCVGAWRMAAWSDLLDHREGKLAVELELTEQRVLRTDGLRLPDQRASPGPSVSCGLSFAGALAGPAARSLPRPRAAGRGSGRWRAAFVLVASACSPSLKRLRARASTELAHTQPFAQPFAQPAHASLHWPMAPACRRAVMNGDAV